MGFSTYDRTKKLKMRAKIPTPIPYTHHKQSETDREEEQGWGLRLQGVGMLQVADEGVVPLFLEGFLVGDLTLQVQLQHLGGLHDDGVEQPAEAPAVVAPQEIYVLHYAGHHLLKQILSGQRPTAQDHS